MSFNTVQSKPVQSLHNGKWACVFLMMREHNGKPYVAGELTSSAVWFDKDAARVAGERAMQTLAETDRWPNMCEVW